jgi:V8-like Glu-specific endopeptidase
MRAPLIVVAVAAAALCCPVSPALGVPSSAGGAGQQGSSLASFGRLGAAPQRARRHWTAERLRGAEPLAVLDAGAGGGAAAGAGAEGEAAAAGGASAAASASTVPAVRPRSSTAVSGYTSFPHSANGALFGVYVKGLRTEEYRCSASAIASSAGNLVLTAGHCVVDPESGAVARYLVFVPGYHEGNEPLGVWAVTEYGVPAAWSQTAGTSQVDESGDMAILRVQARESDGASLQSVTGALGIAFNQPRSQLYTQFGYPAKYPYNGERLYEEVAEYVGVDNSFTPSTVGVDSDFTPGSSGGPWTTGGGAPVALSVTAYAYGTHSGQLFGPYFGAAVKSLYQRAAEDPAADGSGNVSIRLKSVAHQDGAGTAKLRVALPAGGKLALRGGSIVATDVHAGRAKTLTVLLRASGSKLRTLRRDGSVSVTATLTYRNEENVGNRLRRTVKLVDSGG